LSQKSFKFGNRVTEVADDDGKCSVDAGRVLNDLLKGHKVGNKAISWWTILSGNISVVMIKLGDPQKGGHRGLLNIHPRPLGTKSERFDIAGNRSLII
jgi:hypothetical protein